MKKEKGIVTYVYEDGDKIRLNLVDENSSVLVTFSNKDEFADFIRTVNKAGKEILGK